MLAMTPLAELAQENTPTVDLTVQFPWWYVLLVEPNREPKSAEMLIRLNMNCYLPTFVKQRRLGGPLRARRPRLYAVMPGMLFIPADYLNMPRREDAFKLAHVRGFMRGSMGKEVCLSKANIEIIREIEAKLNLPPERKGVLFQVGQQVRFVNELYAAFWGIGIIVEVASETRIGVEIKKLFGGPTKVYIPAAEIEAM